MGSSPQEAPVLSHSRYDEIAIGALVTSAEARERLGVVLPSVGAAHFVDTPAELLELVSTHAVDKVIVEAGDDSAGSTEALIQALRRQSASLLILAYCQLTPGQVKRLPALIRAGVDELILGGIDDDEHALRRALARSCMDRLAEDALNELGSFVSERGVPVLAYCLTHADQPVTVAQMARDLGLHRKTLFSRVSAEGLPSPAALISWCRLIHAARLLDDAGRSVEHAAEALGFGSATALRNMLRRYTGLRTAELRGSGSHRMLIGLFQRELAGARRNRRDEVPQLGAFPVSPARAHGHRV